MGTLITAAVLLVALAVAGVLYFVMRPPGKQTFADAGTPFTPKPGSMGAGGETLGDHIQGILFPKG